MTTSNSQTTKPLWKSFVNPGWVIAAILAIAFSWFAITWLSPWQLNKDHDIKERNQRIEAAFEADPVDVNTILAEGYTPEKEWTRVTMTGHYNPDSEILLRLRPVDGTPAFQSLVPFTLDSGDTILVNRGWVPAAEGGTRVPSFDPAPAGTTTLSAMLRTSDPATESTPLEEQGYTMVQTIHTPQIAEVTSQDLVSPYAQLLSDQPGVLHPIPLPMLDRGNHLSYGLQWIAFGIMAPAGLAYFLYSEIRERRRYRDEQREMETLTSVSTDSSGSSDSTAASPDESASSTAPEVSAAAPAPARARYGQSRKNPWAEKGHKGF